MKIKLFDSRQIKKLIILLVTFLAFSQTVQANPLGVPGVPQIPQIPAFLPMAMDVPMGKKLPIDGEWMINDIRKRIRIEGGRAYAVDSWVHLFVLKIGPMMVVSQDWRRTGVGEYSGQDLPLVGPFTASLDASGNLKVSVQGMLGPVNLTLSPVRIDSRSKFEREKRRKGGVSDGSDSYEDEEGWDGEEWDESEEEWDETEEEWDETEEEWNETEEEWNETEEEWNETEEEWDETEEEPTKVAAKSYKRAKKGCEGKQVYRSGTKCYRCPNGYKRTSLTRKMTHPEACKERGVKLNKKKTSAKYVWGANGCPRYQFKHEGYCKKCPKGSKRIHVAGIDTGYCRLQ